MKKTYMIAIQLVIILFFLSSCEGFVSDVDAPQTEAKLSVNSYISPENDTIRVLVQLTKPLYTTRPAYTEGFTVVSDATVDLSDGVNSIRLVYQSGKGSYFCKSTDFPIVAGRTYFLNVSTSNGKIATSQCTVPLASPPTIEITNIEEFNDYGYAEKAVSFRFLDLEGSGNFYRVQAGIRYSYDMEYNYVYNLYLENGEELSTDSNKEGEYFLYKTERIGSDPSQSNNIYIFIANTDENYYNYHRSIFNFQDDNPFSEPTPVYSNISGGVGVFAAYKSRMITINLN